jgi:hypothetical protein
MMNKEAREIVEKFKDGASVDYIARTWVLPLGAVEGILRNALLVQNKVQQIKISLDYLKDKKKGKA